MDINHDGRAVKRARARLRSLSARSVVKLEMYLQLTEPIDFHPTTNRAPGRRYFIVNGIHLQEVLGNNGGAKQQSSIPSTWQLHLSSIPVAPTTKFAVFYHSRYLLVIRIVAQWFT